MEVKAYKYKDAREDCVSEWYGRRYLGREGLAMEETLTYQSISDFADARKRRVSEDGGKTWSDWEIAYDSKAPIMTQGDHVMDPSFGYGGTIWNPVHKHYVTIKNQYIWIGGYDNANYYLWQKGDNRYLASHAFIEVADENKQEKYSEMIRYQDGAEFDPDDWAKPEYAFRNYALAFTPQILDDSGDLFIAMEVPMRHCCEMLGRDILDYYPHDPDYPNGMLIMRGIWDGEKYNFTHGTPIVISDRFSSRGLSEACVAKLESGRIVVIMRGSNAKMPWKKQYFEPGTPGFKWYSWSDDNGETFTECMPWRFDDGEIIYSSATFSRIFKDERTGKHYWIGNITDHKVKGNYPRFPLNIVEIDEKYGTAKKESLTVIDTRREGEPETVQLSNFDLLFNRETEKLEIRLAKLGQFDNDKQLFKSEAWTYEIDVEA